MTHHIHPTHPANRRAGRRRLALAAAVVMLSAGCAAPGGTAAADRPLVVGIAIATLDPVLANQIQNDLPDTGLYEPLLDYDKKGAIRPRLAASWSVAPDARSVTLALNPKATFASGTPVTAADVVYTLDRTRAVGTGVASVLADFKQAEALDDHHVRISLTRGDVAFLGGLSQIYVLDSKVVRQHEGTDHAQAWLASHAAGSGPYTRESFAQGSEIKLKLNQNYWGGKLAGRPGEIVLSDVNDNNVSRNGLLAGQYDAALQGSRNAASFRNNSKFRVVKRKLVSQNYFWFNTKRPALSDVRVRRAIALAFDYSGFTTRVEGGDATVADGILPVGMSCRVATGRSHQDKAEAKRLLTEAGVNHLRITGEYQTWNPEHVQAATLLQSDLRDIGVTLDLKQVTFPAYVAQLAKPETTPDLMYLLDGPLFPDSGPTLERTYSTSAIGHGSNYANYSNPKADALISKAVSDTDVSSRCAEIQRAQRIIADDQVSLNVSNNVQTMVVRKGITGLGDGDGYRFLDLTTIRQTGAR
ncbi:ABC transporter substrate-binding protein [Streptomyces sp. NPDC055692]|uniref:ABC transporter substrate-binding protein n=1 Tax=Streptomyces sp. NPDC055692 TaxID=3155683 RepID=UPI0034248830